MAAGLIVAGVISFCAGGAAWSQTPPAKTDAKPAATQATAAPAPAAAYPAVKLPPCNNPDALGVSRVVEIDTTGGPGFGFEHFKQLDFLRDKAVFSIFRRASEMPLYRIVKDPSLAQRQGAYSVLAPTGMILKRGHDLARVLQAIDKPLRLVV